MLDGYAVRSLRVGRGEVAGPQVFWMSHWAERLPLEFQVVLIQGHGVTALVNSGLPEDLSLFGTPANPRGWLQREPEERIEAALASAGVHPDQVTHLVLTPLQLYTTANIPLFTNAKICLARRGWVHFHTSHDHPHDTRWRSIPRDVLVHLITDAWDQVVLMDDEHEIAPGLRTWWAGTHHRASIVVEADTPDGTVAISDAFFYYENVEDNQILGINENMYEALATYQRVRDHARHILPLYDPKVFQRYPGGVISTGGR